jgi:very-short-patch-repair endonuclease
LKNSIIKVKVLCDYCLEEGIETEMIKTYKNYILQNEKEMIHKDSCVKCKHKKARESNMIKYGVEHTAFLSSTNEKRMKTNLERYGSKSPMGNIDILEKAKNKSREKFGKDYYMQTKEYKERVINTNLNKYGTEYTFQSEEIKEKIKQSNLEKYGYENPSQSPIIKEKVKNTHLKRYGVEIFSQDPEKQRKSLIKAKVTMYKNQTAPSSMQQRYLCNVVGGELNYPVGICSLDIAFPNEKIYLEYDGSGHELSVKFGTVTKKEIKEKEINRFYFLRKNGWRSIRIISKKDLLPSEEKIIEMFKLGKKLLKNRSWVEFNIDTSTVKTSKGELKYNFGELINRYYLEKYIMI